MITRIITIFCAIMFIGLGIAWPEMTLDFSVPVPEETELLDTKALRLANRQIQTFLYQSQESPWDIVDYYREFFADQGFEKILDKKGVGRDKRFLLRFKKEDLVVSISIKPKFEETQIVIAKYLQPEDRPSLEESKPSFKDFPFALPKTDQPGGKDLRIIPRPPKSIRWVSLDRGRQVYLIYATSLSVLETRDFYKRRMPNQGWQMQRDMATREAIDTYKARGGKGDLKIPNPFIDGEDFNAIMRDSYALNFQGPSGRARITIFPNFVDRKLGSIVHIVYNQGD